MLGVFAETTVDTWLIVLTVVLALLVFGVFWRR